MSATPAAPDRVPPRPVLLLIAAAMAAMGAVMLLHGFGLLSATWFNPNPKVPLWVFALLGVILLLAAWLTLGKAYQIPKATRHAAGLAIIGLSIVAMHWLVFFAKGGSCGLDGASFVIGLPQSLCGAVMGAAVIVLDLILLLVGIATLRSYRRG